MNREIYRRFQINLQSINLGVKQAANKLAEQILSSVMQTSGV